MCGEKRFKKFLTPLNIRVEFQLKYVEINIVQCLDVFKHMLKIM
jgi:hypothetical protein